MPGTVLIDTFNIKDALDNYKFSASVIANKFTTLAWASSPPIGCSVDCMATINNRVSYVRTVDAEILF